MPFPCVSFPFVCMCSAFHRLQKQGLLDLTSIYAPPPRSLSSFLLIRLWLLARGWRSICWHDVLISSVSRKYFRREEKKNTRVSRAGCKNIAAPWEITRVEILGWPQGQAAALNARIMKMPIRSLDVLDTGLYCIRRETQLSDNGVFVNIKCNHRAVFALRNL